MPPIKSEPGVRIKTEPGVRIKPEHEARCDFSSIPRPPVALAPVKQEHHIKREDRVKQEDRKPYLSSSTYDSQSSGRRRIRSRHSKNYIIHRLRDGETIRAQYRQSEGAVVFTLSSRAPTILEEFPDEADRAEERIFQRLQRAHFHIRPTEPSGFLYRKMRHARVAYKDGVSQTVLDVEVEHMSEHSEAEDEFVSERTPNFGALGRGEHTEPPPSFESSSVNFPPAAHPLQISSTFGEPSQGISAIFRLKERAGTDVSQVAPENSSSSTSFGFPFAQEVPSVFGTPHYSLPIPRPRPASSVKPAQEVIVIDSSPESSPKS